MLNEVTHLIVHVVEEKDCQMHAHRPTVSTVVHY